MPTSTPDYAYFYSREYAQDLDTHLKDDFEAHCDIFNATLLLVKPANHPICFWVYSFWISNTRI